MYGLSMGWHIQEYVAPRTDWLHLDLRGFFLVIGWLEVLGYNFGLIRGLSPKCISKFGMVTTKLKEGTICNHYS